MRPRLLHGRIGTKKKKYVACMTHKVISAVGKNEPDDEKEWGRDNKVLRSVTVNFVGIEFIFLVFLFNWQ